MVWEKGNTLVLLMKMEIDIAIMENSMEIPLKKKLGIKLPYDLTISLLGILPEETIIEKDMCTPKFTEELFKIARTWKQSSYP